MSRVLKRPMFKMGGSASGITTGLDRPGYDQGGRLSFTKDDYRTMIDTSKELAQEFAPQQGADINRFLINFGLDLASRSPQGGLISTAAAAAKGPTADLYESIDRDKLMRGKTGADIFSEIIAAEGEAASGGDKQWLDSEKLRAMQVARDGIRDTRPKLNKLIQKHPKWEDLPDTDPIKQQIIEYRNTIEDHNATINQYKKENLFISSLSRSPLIMEKFFKTTMAKLENEMIPIEITTENIEQYPDGPDGPTEIGDTIYVKKYVTNKKDPRYNEGQLIHDTIEEMKRSFGEQDFSYLGESKAAGGRVGYQMGSLVEEQVTEDVYPQAGPTAPPLDTSQAPEIAPVGMTYDELRARLPETISDEIVILLSQSGQALEDFATIQTQQDVDNFNTKYNVNLILPAEA